MQITINNMFCLDVGVNPKNVLQADRAFKTMCMCRNLSSGVHDGQPHCSILLHARSPRRMLLDLRSRNGFAAGVHSKTEIVLQLEGDSKSMCILSTHMVTHSTEHF